MKSIKLFITISSSLNPPDLEKLNSGVQISLVEKRKKFFNSMKNSKVNNKNLDDFKNKEEIYDAMAKSLKAQIKRDLAELKALSLDDMLEQRYEKLMSFGYC